MSASRSALDLKFWLLTIVSAACAALTAVNLVWYFDVSQQQAEVLARQQFINESVPLARVNTQIIQALANLSAQTNDTAIRDMLGRHGVTFTVNETSSAPNAEAEAEAGQ